MSILNIFSSIVSPVTDLFSKRGEAKHEEIAADQAQVQLETKVEAEAAQQDAAGREAYDLQALKQKDKTFLDEYYGYMWALPIMASFVPFLQPFVASGWLMLATVPSWYQAVLVGILCSTFGLRFLFDKRK
jgi:hypothetical protein